MSDEKAEVEELQERLLGVEKEIGSLEAELTETMEEMRDGEPTIKFWGLCAVVFALLTILAGLATLVLALLPEPLVTKGGAAVVALVAKTAALVTVLLALVALVVAAMQARRKSGLATFSDSLEEKRLAARKLADELEAKKAELEGKPH